MTPETQVVLAVERPAVLAVVRRGQRRTSLVSALTKGVCIIEGCSVMAPCCRQCHNDAKGVPSAESSHNMRGLGKGVSGKPYPRLCNARRPRLEPGTIRSQTVSNDQYHCDGCAICRTGGADNFFHCDKLVSL
ncbi:E3 ubiquitin-protein ligase RZFP34-like [Miscanthus floridulus]|uniref:E3 ubiquitin-protein ligase RZFP34-like n=1 Tax=Miscanthus floridulus TaxID=154761 RepID=UPI003458658D